MTTKVRLAMDYYDTATLHQEILGLFEGQIDLLLLGLEKGRVTSVEDGLNVLSLMVQDLQTTADKIVEDAGKKLEQTREEGADDSN